MRWCEALTLQPKMKQVGRLFESYEERQDEKVSSLSLTSLMNNLALSLVSL